MNKLKLFFTLLLAVVGMNCAWAYRHVWDTSKLTNGSIIAIQCVEGSFTYFDGTGTKTDNITYNNLFKLESASEGKFYLKRLSDGKYLGMTSGYGLQLDETATSEFAISNPRTANETFNWDAETPMPGANADRMLRFTTGGQKLNSQGTGSCTYKAGNGGWSVWYTYLFGTEDNINETAKTVAPRQIPMDLSQISNNKKYTVEANRLATPESGVSAYHAYLSYNSATSTTNLIHTSTVRGDNEHFVFHKSAAGFWYMYSVGAQKFVNKRDNGVGVYDAPQNLAFTLTDNYANSNDFNWVLKDGDSQFNVTSRETSYFGVISFWNSLTDAGNQFQIIEAGDFTATDDIVSALANGPEGTAVWNLSDISDSKVYYIYNNVSPLVTNSQVESRRNYVTTTSSNGQTNATADKTSAYQQFALVRSANGTYYMYSVGMQKFVSYEDNQHWSLTDDIQTSFQIVDNRTNNNTYRWAIKDLKNHMFHVSTGYETGFISYMSLGGPGCQFMIEAVGDLSAETLAAIQTKINAREDAQPVSLDQFSNAYKYVLDCDRGGLYGDEDGVFGTTVKKGVEIDSTSTAQQFAILRQANGKFFLYSVAAKKFATWDNGWTLTDTPTFINVNDNHANNAEFSWTFTFNSSTMLHANNNHSSAPNGLMNYNSATDPSSQWRVVKVGGFDPSEAFEKIIGAKVAQANEDGTWADGTKIYWLKNYNSDKKCVYNPGNMKIENNASASLENLYAYYTITGNPIDGYQIHNVYYGPTKVACSDNNDNGTAVYFGNDATQRFDIGKNDNGIFLLKKGTTNAYWNDFSDQCKYWTSSDGTDTGSRFYFVEADEDVVLNAAKAQLTTEKTAMSEHADEGYGYYKQSDIDGVAIADGATALQAVNAIYSLRNLDVLAPEDGDFLMLKSADRSKIMSSVYATHTGATNRPSLVADESTSTIWYYTNGKLVSYGMGGAMNDWDLKSLGSEAGNVTFTPHPSNNTKFYVKSGSHYLYNGYDGYLDGGSITLTNANEPYTWTLEEVTTLPVTIGATGYASLNLPVATTIPTGVEAWYASALNQNDNTLTLTRLEADATLPQDFAVILRQVSGESPYDFNIVADVASKPNNEFRGTVAAERFDAKSIKVLGIKNGSSESDPVVGLYTYTGTTLGGFKMYYAGTAEVRLMWNDVATAIEAAENESMHEGVMYNLNGQRVMKQNGLVIVNGKKIVVKE